MENTATTAAPLLENEYVKELLAVMEANRVPAVKDLLAVFNEVSAMERQLDTAEALRSAEHPRSQRKTRAGAKIRPCRRKVSVCVP